MRKLSHEELLSRQKGRMREPRPPLTVVLNNIRSLYNVGSIFRTADGAGVEKIWICGITGHPPNSQIAKTALGAEQQVPWEYRERASEVVCHLKDAGYRVVMLEQTEESIPYQNFTPDGPVCLVVGNEVEGIEDGMIPLCDQALEIEMDGLKNSLNVSVAFGIVAYHLRNCLKKSGK